MDQASGSISRTFYRLAAALLFLALIAGALTFTQSSLQPGLTGTGSLWQTIGLFLFLGATLCTFAGVMTALFEQVERRNRQKAEMEATRRRDRSSTRR